MVHVDRDLWRERQKGYRNGNGNGPGWQKWPWSAIVAAVLAVAGWIITSVLWGARLEGDLRVLQQRMNHIEHRTDAVTDYLTRNSSFRLQSENPANR